MVSVTVADVTLLDIGDLGKWHSGQNDLGAIRYESREADSLSS